MSDAGLQHSSVGLDPSCLTFRCLVTGEGQCAGLQRGAAHGPRWNSRNSRRSISRPATGQGKTHLLHAIGHAYPAGAHPRARFIFYCSAERFMVEFVQALKIQPDHRVQGHGCRSFDLLLVGRYPVHHRQGEARRKNCSTPSMPPAGRGQAAECSLADRAPQALDGVEPRLLVRALSMGLGGRYSARRHRIAQEDPWCQAGCGFCPPLDVPADVVEFPRPHHHPQYSR